MASITVMKNYVIKKAQGTSDENLKKIVKVLKNYNKLDAESKKKVGGAVEKLYSKFKAQESKKTESKPSGAKKSTGSGKKKYKPQDFKSVLLAFKKKIGDKAFKEATRGTTIKQDSERPALPKGKRKVTKKGYTTNAYGTFKNKVGRAYWENRANRFDAKQPPKNFPKLAEGGNTSEKYSLVVFSEEEYKGLKSTWMDRFEIKADSLSEAKKIAEKELKEKIPYSTRKNSDNFKIKEIITMDEYKDRFEYKGNKFQPKKFAKGGMIEHGLKIGDKIIDTFQDDIFIHNNGEKFQINLNKGTRVKLS